MDVPPQAVWAVGLALVAADMLTSPYWQDVVAIGLQGHLANHLAPSGTAGLWQTGGLFLMTALLAGLAGISRGGGEFALAFLAVAWIIFGLHHTTELNALFTKFRG